MAEKSSSENAFSKFSEFQNEMFNLWVKPFFAFGQSEKEQEKKVASSNQTAYFDAFNNWLKLSTNSLNFFGFGGFNDTIQRLATTNEAYLSLFRLWENISKQVTGEQKQVSDFFNVWRDQYTKLISANIIPVLPEPVRSALKEPQEIFEMYINTMSKLFNPWLNNYSEFQALLSKGLGGSKDAYLEFTKRWKELYENSFGKLLKAPNLGMSREFSDKLAESTDKFIRYIQVLSEYTAIVYKVGMDNMESLLNNYMDMVKQDSQPKTFKEFYELWWKSNEDAYQTLFGTENFSKLLAQVVDATVTFKQNQNKLIEEYLKEIPIPVKSDMDGLYKTVYELKKDVKKMKREIELLRKDTGESEKELDI
jgi:class III poly(R)-hydroxyalkanoic acid synthase PhaE subunit